MRATYTLNDGYTKLEIYLYQDILSGNNIRQFIDFENQKGETVEKEIYKDHYGLYIIYNDQRIYLNDYEYLSAEKLIEFIESKRVYVYDDTILATLLKESDKLLVYYPVIYTAGYNIDKLIPCEFTETNVYKRHEWGSKITISPIDEDHQRHKTVYFSDFCKNIRDGNAFFKLRK